MSKALRQPNVCAVRHLGRCSGRLHNHHVIKRQHIRQCHRTLAAAYRHGAPPPTWKLSVAIADPRLQVKVCSGITGHHRLEGAARLYIPAGELHPGFWDAVREYGLEAHVPPHLSETR